jgi:hypothetical protein
MVSDMRSVDMSKSDDNKFISRYDLLNVHVYKDQTLQDFVQDNLNPDQIGLFYSIVGNTSHDIDMSYEQAKTCCKYNPKETCVTSLLVLNDNQSILPSRYITFDEYTVVYNRDTLRRLRRQILGNHPGTVDDFMRECQRCFPKLVFHDCCKKSLVYDFYYLDFIPRKLVYYLSCLNDGYAEIFEAHQDQSQGINNTLKYFSGKYNLDDFGSRQGNPQEKEKLEYDFEVNGAKKILYCESHLKINAPDDDKYCDKRRQFTPRIYFYPNFCIELGVIYIGSMGTHL